LLCHGKCHSNIVVYVTSRAQQFGLPLRSGASLALASTADRSTREMTMEVGIGLPAAIPAVDGRTIVDWARRAEQLGFSSLAEIDRMHYDNYEPIVALAAAAAVTERIRLTTSILLAPLRTNHTLFAKQTASLDRLAGGRLVLGIGVGRRESDYTVSGTDYHQRGSDLDALLERASALWRGETADFGPAPANPGGPRLIFGGDSPRALRRMATYGEGWIAGGGFGDVFRAGAAAACEEWTRAGRPGRPRLLALAYFALGADARDAASGYLRHYYAFVGSFAEQIAAGALVTGEGIRERVAELAQAGCDELILMPCGADLSQVDLLAEALAR
jgi:alkanesulfonate monooxygenase SsuD/methylene tetrahydromethanopterin reductase-like flavin-dependent oxidoreductase (luciferase family)